MKKMLKVGGFSVEPGEKLQDYLIIKSIGAKIPVTLINGTRGGKTVAITSGIHGGEYPGIETAIRLATELEPKDVKGALLIAHPVNEASFYAKTQYISPLDGKNLNRSFPGEAGGTVSQALAYTVTNEFIKQADFYMDLHCGDIHEDLIPFAICTTAADEKINAYSKEVAAALVGIKYVCGSASITGTYGWAGQIGVPGFLAELGGRGLWSEEEVSVYLNAVKNALRKLEVIDGGFERHEPVFLEKMLAVNAKTTGLWYPAVKPGQQVKRHDKMGQIRDPFGKVLADYSAEKDGVVLYVVSSLPVCEGEPVYALG